MKKFLIAASILFVGTASAEIDFYATAPDFYGKANGELSKSKPIGIYNKLIAEEKVSPDEAAKAYKELRAIRSIRTAIGEKYPGAGLLARRTGGFGGFFGFGQPEDYTESALTIIESKLAAAGNVDTSKDPFTDIRAEVVKTITPHFTAEENTKLNQLVELEALWGSDEENAKNRETLLALTQKIGIEAAVKKLLPELTVEESKKEESKPAVEEPQAPTGYNFNSPDFYKNDTGGVLYDSKPAVAYRELIDGNKKAIDPALFKEFRALREIKKALSGARSAENDGEYKEFALNIISNKLAEASKQKDAHDAFAPLRAGIVEKIKGDNSKLNQLIELEKIWGGNEENAKNQEALLQHARAINAENIIQPLLTPLPETTEEEFPEETAPEPEPVTPKEPIQPAEEPKKEEPTKEAQQPEEKIPTQPRRPTGPGRRPPSRKEIEIPTRFKSVDSKIFNAIKDAADAVALKSINDLWESTEMSHQRAVIQAAEALGIWEAIKNLPNAPKEQLLSEEKPKESAPPTKHTIFKNLANEAMAVKKTMGQPPQPTPVATLTSSLEKISYALHKLTLASAAKP